MINEVLILLIFIGIILGISICVQRKRKEDFGGGGHGGGGGRGWGGRGYGGWGYRGRGYWGGGFPVIYNTVWGVDTNDCCTWSERGCEWIDSDGKSHYGSLEDCRKNKK